MRSGRRPFGLGPHTIRASTESTDRWFILLFGAQISANNKNKSNVSKKTKTFCNLSFEGSVTITCRRDDNFSLPRTK
jgi:hypothetical protein